jgi:probable HAF family extracellular repeat protein
MSAWPQAVMSVGAEGLHFHDLRHTGNTFAAAAGAGIKDLMARMGHDSERAAMIYQRQARGADKTITRSIGADIASWHGSWERYAPGRPPNRGHDIGRARSNAQGVPAPVRYGRDSFPAGRAGPPHRSMPALFRTGPDGPKEEIAVRPTTSTALRLAAAVSTAAALAAAAAGLPAAPAGAATTTYTITNLGTLGGTGEFPQTEPSAINAGGQATGFSYTSQVITFTCPVHYKPPRTCSYHPQHAFLYSNGTMTDLGTLGGIGSSGFAINRSGEVAGVAQTATGKSDAALWTGTTTVDLGALAPLSSGSKSEATGINDSGQVVGYWYPSGTGGVRPWLYSNGTMTSLPEPSNLTSTSCAPGAINNSGEIVGYCLDASGNYHAVLWQNGTVTTLGTLGGLQATSAYAINNNGQIAGEGTTSTGASHGFLDSNGTVTDLGSFTPFALNDNGVMIDPSGPSIDSGGTVQNLNNLIASSGYQLNDAFAINDNGQIAAYTTAGQGVLLTPN